MQPMWHEEPASPSERAHLSVAYLLQSVMLLEENLLLCVIKGKVYPLCKQCVLTKLAARRPEHKQDCFAGRADHCIRQLRAHRQPGSQISANNAHPDPGRAAPQVLCSEVGVAGPLSSTPVSHNARSAQTICLTISHLPMPLVMRQLQGQG